MYTDATTVFLGEAEASAHHVGRGHTNGDSVILFPDLGVIHTGDLFVGGSPFIDYNNGGSVVEWTTTLDDILALDFDTVIPGHGNIMDKDDVREFRRKMQTMLERARELVSQGVPEEEFRSRLDTQDLGWDYSSGFAASSVPGMYHELTQAR